MMLGAMLRLMLLAPVIVEAIIDGTQSPEITIPILVQPFSWPGTHRLSPHAVAPISQVT